VLVSDAESVAAPAPIELDDEPVAASSSIFCCSVLESVEEEPFLGDIVLESLFIEEPEPIVEDEPDGVVLDDDEEPDWASAVMLNRAAATVNTNNFFISTSMFILKSCFLF
jgi:hypothetical protein